MAKNELLWQLVFFGAVFYHFDFESAQVVYT